MFFVIIIGHAHVFKVLVRFNFPSDKGILSLLSTQLRDHHGRLSVNP
jgi:hypothetical protein